MQSLSLHLCAHHFQVCLVEKRLWDGNLPCLEIAACPCSSTRNRLLSASARHLDGLKFAAVPHRHGGCTRLVAGLKGVLEALGFQAALPEEPLAFSLPEEWGRGHFGPVGPPGGSMRSVQRWLLTLGVVGGRKLFPARLGE